MVDVAGSSQAITFLMTKVRPSNYQEFNFFIWRSTRDGQNFSDYWLEKCQKCFFQFVYTVAKKKFMKVWW